MLSSSKSADSASSYKIVNISLNFLKDSISSGSSNNLFSFDMLGEGARNLEDAERYFQDSNSDVQKLIPEGVEGQVPYKGPVNIILNQLIGGLRSSMGYTGNENIKKMKINSEFIKITRSGLKESHVHDVTITKESPNYKPEGTN